MVGTVRAARGRRETALAGTAFAVGLSLGAALIFGSLGALGAALHPGWIPVAIVAAVAALIDFAGFRVRPQIRFQVPEPWRRTMPLSRALFLYGLLLGTGVATLVPAAAAWALFVLCLALGSVPGALAIGLSFAAGRALPVLALAARGNETVLAERPQGLRLLRVLAAGSLVLALAAGEARAASRVAAPAGDPVAAGTDLVWNEPGVGGFLLRGGQRTQLPGTDPAIGGPYIAWRNGGAVTVAAADTLQPVFELTIPGAEKLAVSERWLVFRVALPSGKEQLRALSFTDPATVRVLTAAWARGRLGRPSLGHNMVVYHLVTARGSELFSINLLTDKQRLLRSSRRDLLLNPSRVGSRLLYEQVGRCGQQLRLGSLKGARPGRLLYRLPPLAGEDLGHEKGHTTQGEHLPCPRPPRPTSRMLWTTALTPTTAFVTVLRPSGGGRTTPSLLAIAR